MNTRSFSPRRQKNKKVKPEDIKAVVTRARREQKKLEETYRERSLKIHPWVCARCGREFTSQNLHELTVHHKDHDHTHNPPDGSNWENLCIYCHENEHRRHLDHLEAKGMEVGGDQDSGFTHNPFAKLKGLLKEE
ncbi:MAG: YajD family HNH nuclease [Desulfatiglandaceae bacterium]